jgi:hypothetical protein
MANQEQDYATDVISDLYLENGSVLGLILLWRGGERRLTYFDGVESAEGVCTAKRKILKNVRSHLQEYADQPDKYSEVSSQLPCESSR